MALHRLAIRTKKSLSGLYSSHDDMECGWTSPDAVARETQKKLTITPPKTMCSFVDDFGVLRNGDNTPPSDRESPSRRHRLLGSLRSMKSLRSLRSSHSSSKKSEEEHAKSESPQTPVRETLSVSLNFEASPVDEPMFGSMTRTTSGSSSLRVYHSSPISVLPASRNTTPITPGAPSRVEDVVFGTVPDSPAPLQRLYAQEATLDNVAKASPHIIPSDLAVETSPPPTPMPGTNLPLGDISPPDIMVTSPSAPYIQRESQSSQFAMFTDVCANGYERTKTLDTESGFPTPLFNMSSERFQSQQGSEASMKGFDGADLLVTTVMDSEPDAASFDEPFGLVSDSYDLLAKPVIFSNMKSYGEGPEYAVYDNTGTMDEVAAETRLRAAIQDLDDTTQAAQSPVMDNEQELQDIVRAYARLRSGTGSDDDGGGIAIEQPDVTQEMLEDVETSIRLMNRSLGG